MRTSVCEASRPRRQFFPPQMAPATIAGLIIRAYYRGMPEQVILVDLQDHPLSVAEKTAAHQHGGRLHRAFSIFVFDSGGRLLLQQRAAGKYHFALRWSNTCCGHPRPGEATLDAARRRLAEEFGIQPELREVAPLIYRADDAPSGLTEHEYLHIFAARFDGQPRPDPREIASFRWIDAAALRAELAAHLEKFTPWFPLAYEKVVTQVNED